METGYRPLRWLHLSDLHLGCRGQELWWQVQEDLEESIRHGVKRLGSPDLVLLTGDLSFRGAPEEFEQVDRFLDALLGWIRKAGDGPEPLIIAVPGNHDLIRPRGRSAFTYRVLDKYMEGGDNKDVRLIEDELWSDRDASYIEPLFTGYQAWFERRILPSLEEKAVRLHRSHFPGDFSLELEIDGTSLAIVALNSTWQQYRAGDFEGRLVIPTRQFHAALSSATEDPPFEIFKRCSRALLLLHQPPTWLAPSARRTFLQEIYTPTRFDLCLYGHLHHGRAEMIAEYGGQPRCYLQAPSLFGIEHYGSSREERAVGYVWGSLAPDGTVRIWPLRRVTRRTREAAFVHDDEFPEAPSGVVICNRPRGSIPALEKELDLTRYLEALVGQTDHIDISGIVSEAKQALRQPIESLYTPLSSHGFSEEELIALGLERERVALTDLLPHGRLLIEGQPGAGKTTFLRLTACMLARDALGLPCPGGGSWRRQHLGLPADSEPKIPVLLQFSTLVSWLNSEEASRLRYDNRFWLLELLAQASNENGHPIRKEHWEKLFTDGRAFLLFDGLDEAAEETMRSRILRIVRDACRHWPCPVVLTSRPLDTTSLKDMDFQTATIEPFSRDDIRTFVDRWVTALHHVEHAFPGGEAQRYCEALNQAIVNRARVRRLAANPVMLTCLCVVYWNVGRMPEGRSRLYQAVLKWLIKSRSKLRRSEGFSNLFAEWAFARLALAMCTGEGGKQATVDLEDAAVVIAPLLTREQPELTAEKRRSRARQWLAFECLGSGILEEVSGKRLRFWHLTFQEFLAARQLSWRGEGDSKRKDWWPLVRDHLDDAQWRETVEMLPGCLLEGGPRRVDRLLERVLSLRHESSNLATEARVAGILGRLLKPVGALGYKPAAEISAAHEEALKRSLEIFDLKGASRMTAAQRIAAAEALGRGGDPRLTPGGVDHFLAVPGLGGCKLGKYPVTVEDFQRFVEGQGYEDQQLWGDLGWGLREEMGWVMPEDWDEQLQYPSRPVVGVSWYEARAYCTWRSELGKQLIRLPSEREWKMAATSDTGKFPWGSQEPTAELANFALQVGKPTPVGVYPAGNGQYDHCDLAGNVWEWCADRASGQGFGSRTLPPRVLRGGCWTNPASVLHTAFRGWARPTVQHILVGFRVLADTRIDHGRENRAAGN